MASFVIHNIAGERILKLLEENYGVNLTEKEKTDFIFGNLIVDSSKLKFQNIDGLSEQESKKVFRKKVQEEKKITHFRSDDDADLCIQTPCLEKFFEKYDYLLGKDISVLGYLFHLYTDKMFFEGLFGSTVETLDKDMKPTVYTSETKMMMVKRSNKLYNLDEFWSSDSKTSIYQDYTIMNKLLLEHYGCNFDKDVLISKVLSFVNPGIEEVNYSNILGVINKTALFIKDSYNIEKCSLNVFDEHDVIDFIDNISIDFINKYFDLFKINDSKNIKSYKRCI